MGSKTLKRVGTALVTGGASETTRLAAKGAEKGVDKVVDTIVPKLPDPNDFLPTQSEPETAPAVDEQAQVRFRSSIDQQRRRKGRRNSVLTTNRRSLTSSSQGQGAATLG